MRKTTTDDEVIVRRLSAGAGCRHNASLAGSELGSVSFYRNGSQGIAVADVEKMKTWKTPQFEKQPMTK